MKPVETVQTEHGAHTLGFDPERNKVYSFLPETHRASVYVDKALALFPPLNTTVAQEVSRELLIVFRNG